MAGVARFVRALARDAWPTATVRALSGMTQDVVPVNILKTGEDPPLKPDEEYPEWLWGLMEPQPTLSELQQKFMEDPDSLTIEEGRRFLGLKRRADIKARSAK